MVQNNGIGWKNTKNILIIGKKEAIFPKIKLLAKSIEISSKTYVILGNIYAQNKFC